MSSNSDHSVNEIIDWLTYNKVKFERINENTLVEIEQININRSGVNFVIKLDGNILIDSNDISFYWYRRGRFNINFTRLDYTECSQTNLVIEAINIKFIKEEERAAKQFIIDLLKSIKHLNSYDDKLLNKTTILFKAFRFGLNIPDTLITSDKNQIISFKKEMERVVTKGIFESGFSVSKQKSIWQHTSEINDADISTIPPKINYSLLQKLIEKKYDVRIFYINGEVFSSVILSQKYGENLDFREKPDGKPMRILPFRLPKNIHNSIKKLMRHIKMNCASIDMIVDNNNEYYFLEINPVGQFSFISKRCNYYLEEIVAKSISVYEKGYS